MRFLDRLTRETALDLIWGRSATEVAESIVPADVIDRTATVKRVRNRLYNHVRRDRQDRGEKFRPWGRPAKIGVVPLT